MKKEILPPNYLFVYLVLALLLRLLLPLYMINSSYRFLGSILVVVGVGINLWADVLLKKYKTTVKPHEVPNKLVTEGIFGYSRHPMYLGFVFILIGVAFLLGCVSAFISPHLKFINLDVKFIPLEEKNLERVFGSEYLRYKKHVRRWI
jgi:protein-S-isoprenylcysteine O-methyltransferase Ste14